MLTREAIKDRLSTIKNLSKIFFIEKTDQDFINEIINTTNYLDHTCKTIERIYHIINNIEGNIPLCKICKKNKLKFRNLTKGYSQFCSLECANKDPHLVEKIKKVFIHKYGVDNPSKLPEIKQKIKDTWLNKYGVDCCLHAEEIKKKCIETSKEKYGVDHWSKSKIVKDKIKESLSKRTTKEIEKSIDKTKAACLRKYGVDNPSKIREVMDKIQLINRKSFLEKFKTILDKMKFKLVDSIYINNITPHNWECLICSKLFQETWRNMCRGYRCPICFPRHSISSLEIEMLDFLKQFNIIIQTHRRDIIPPKELDFYFPEKNIAIEFNGLYWHSEQMGCHKFYHLEKTKNCYKNGVFLIQIFEDEWVFKKEIVKARLKYILNIPPFNEVIHSRKCEIREINLKDKNDFLEQYHIQGKDKSIIKLGAFYNSNLVSVMTFSKGNISKGSTPKENVWELNRFCSNYNYRLPGIASKFLDYFKKTYIWDEIFSYADKRWSNGNVYYKLGFQLSHITAPNYWYVKNYIRIHRFNLRKKSTEPKNISEFTLRDSEGFLRIWDCGNLKFIIRNAPVGG